MNRTTSAWWLSLVFCFSGTFIAVIDGGGTGCDWNIGRARGQEARSRHGDAKRTVAPGKIAAAQPAGKPDSDAPAGDAPGVAASGVAASGVAEPPITAADREHWSFQPLRRPPPPTRIPSTWPRNPIDQFILAKLVRAGIGPQPAASRETLIRRLALDVTGLPPTPAEVAAFVNDRRPAAYERLVDRLLASPAFGEHAAQAWLDLARWAETDGFEHDKVRSKAWQYRDWVIQAINRDLPYNQFLGLQLAGDELRPGDPWAQAATGFCLAGPDMPDINSQQERRHTVLNDLTSTVGSVFLGLQLGCAQCHDHKFDPLSQGDFYRLRAVFEPAVTFRGHVLAERPPRDSEGQKSHLYLRGDYRRPGPVVEPGFPRVVNLWSQSFQKPAPDAPTSQCRKQLADWLTRPAHPLTSRVMVNRLWAEHFGRGLCETPSDLGLMGDQPRHAELLDWLACELIAQQWSTKRIRRLILTSATYRQASGPTAGGSTASGPTAGNSPRAAEVGSRWEAVVRSDPDNRLWSRFPRRRLTGETLRDAMLAVSESLNRRGHGPSVRPPLPKEVVANLLRPEHWVPSDDPRACDRRSVYVFARRNLRFPMFEAFDRPPATASCPQRSSSTIAPQALLLLNSEFSLRSAERLADRAWQASRGDVDAAISQVYLRCFARRPSGDELAETRAFLAESESANRAAREGLGAARPSSPAPFPETLVDFCLAMLNSNEFVYVE